MVDEREVISDCRIGPERLEVFKDCIETYGMDRNSPDSEWPWNVISKKAIAYTCGRITRLGDQVTHRHRKAEFDLCRSLATEATALMADCNVGMGSESRDPFRPYYVVTSIGAAVPDFVSESLIREAFGGTIYRPTKIVIEALEETGEWWRQVVYDGSGDETYLRPWRAMIRWFHNNRQIRTPAFVMIGDDPLDDQFLNGGCVFPRLAVGLTPAGSLVGIGGWVVHT